VSSALKSGGWVAEGAKAQAQSPAASSTGSGIAVPSAFYRAWLWRLGMGAVRFLPGLVLRQICLVIAEGYYRLHRARREVVNQNLLPVVEDDRAKATKAAHALFQQFAVKMIELWRFEGGMAVGSWFTAGIDWGILEEASRRGKGVLLVTPHLGNWELGGALLAERGFPLLVLTQAEPGQGLTEMRQAARSRRGIETLVIGSDGFEFVEIIKRLQNGASVALLVDRPPAAKAVTVELFGRPFRASAAAAELARASGCAILGVTVVRKAEGYAAKILPEFRYDRAALGSREARRQLTQQIITAFGPEIRQHPDQWFHFVPVWPEGEQIAAATARPNRKPDSQ
jgi:lauroyl/myristoyl acyltransferase